jgi:hypothetical protein
MVHASDTPSETLTDDMIHALRDEAYAAWDHRMVWCCDDAILGFGYARNNARVQVVRVINDARAQDDSRPFVRVTP